MIVDRLLAAAAARAQRRRPPSVGAWNCGKCVRALWYTAHGTMGEPTDARAQLLFALGDKVEESVLEFLTESQTVHIRTNESRDMVHVPELGPSARVRADFFFECELFPFDVLDLETLAYVPSAELPPQPGELLVGEIKSMSNFAFQRAQRGEVDDAYRAQVEVYMRAYGCRHALVIAYRKETSHLLELLIARDDALWAGIQANVRRARAAECPPRPYELEAACKGCAGTGETPARKLPHKACAGTGREPGGPFVPTFPCGYCAYKTACWGALELHVNGDGKPRWRAAAQLPVSDELCAESAAAALA